MKSFKDVDGNNIPFENKRDLYLEEQRDVVSNEITAYLVECNGYRYEVDRKTYEVLSDL